MTPAWADEYAAALMQSPQRAREELAAWRDRRQEAALWDTANTFRDLGELTARFCEGKLQQTPDHGGPRAPETVRIAAPLAHACRQGFVTTCSQPGEAGPSQQRAVVDGWATPETVEQLEDLVRGTRLRLQASERRPWRGSYDKTFPASRYIYPDGTELQETSFGFVPGEATDFIDLGRPDLTENALYVTIHDPEWGPHPLLWERLAEPDWDRPYPPTTEQRRPVELPVGTVLETRDGDDVYRIERLPDGWAIQYREGENEYGATHTSGRISWRAAWSAWGPPSGAGPFTSVPDNAPPLPPPLDLDYPSVSDAVLIPPPPAQPYRAPQRHPMPAARATPAPTSTGGSTMSDIGQVKAHIASANSTLIGTHAVIQHAITETEQAQAAFRTAAEESSQGDVDEAIAALSSVIERLHEALGLSAAAVQSTESVGVRL